MKTQNLIIPFENKLQENIFSQLKGDIILNILKEAKTDRRETLFKHYLEGYSFKIIPEISDYLYDLFEGVRKTLDFNEKVDYYIDNSAESNAYCITKDEDDDAHTLVLRSRLFDTMNEQELKFVIGHELGHLINNNNKLNRIIDIIYPDNIPMVLNHKLKLWNKLSELTADRYGLLACNNIHTAVSVFLKLSSGLSPDNISLNMDAFMKKSIKKVEELQQNEFISSLAHPVNPVRIKAIDLFARSELNKNCKNPAIDKEDLNKEIDELIDVLEFASDDVLEQHRKMFLASGGIIAASCDEEISKEEYQGIVKYLSGFTTFPAVFLNNIYDSDKVNEYFKISVSELLKANPSERYKMFNYFIDVVLVDHDLKEKEINFLYKMGQNVFDFSKKETAQRIADSIREKFIPDLLKL